MWEKRKFGELLATARNNAGLNQRELAEDAPRGLSHSYLSLLEKGTRSGASLTREQLWYLVERLEIWPPFFDEFFLAAGQDPDRSKEEEQKIQRSAQFSELWAFARENIDPDPGWFDIVKSNIVGRGISYRYFCPTHTTFARLVQELREAKVSKQIIEDRLECLVLPDQFFIYNFAIYVGKDLYGCGAREVHGKAETFYTMHPTAAMRLFERLNSLRNSVRIGDSIYLEPAKRFHPEPKMKSIFTSERD